MGSPATDSLNRLVSRAIVDVFAGCQVRLVEAVVFSILPLPEVDPRTGSPTVGAVIPFSGNDVSGSLFLGSTFDLVGESRPREVARRPLVRSASTDWVIARDWVGELANRILGRVKNRMLEIDFGAGMPSALSGHAITLARPEQPSTRIFTFEANKSPVWAWVNARWSSERLSMAPSGAAVAEGAAVLF
jgi:hypothetical protein